MVLYLAEGSLLESVSSNDVVNAIRNRNGVLITYSGEDNPHHGARYIEPYVFGLTNAGNPVIRAYQYYGDTKRGVPKWKLFRLDRIDSWEPTENTFDVEPNARGWAAQAFHGDDELMSQVFNTVELGDGEMTDLERLRMRTQKLKSEKPVNINQFTKQNKEEPTDGPVSDVGIDMQGERHKPLNTDGTPKNDVSQPPIRQERKVDGPIDGNSEETQQPQVDNPQFSGTQGPITGDATNPNNNKAEELMNNKHFADMLRRNIDMTRKTRVQRGLA